MEASEINALLRALALEESDDRAYQLLFQAEKLPPSEHLRIIDLAWEHPDAHARTLKEQARLVRRLTTFAQDAFTDDRSGRKERLEIIRSIQKLFTFWESAEACDHDLVYMFWDMFLPRGKLMWKRIGDDEKLLVTCLKGLLASQNSSVVRSALHGINHLPSRLRGAPIDEFLKTDPPPELAALAVSARTGDLQ